VLRRSRHPSLGRAVERLLDLGRHARGHLAGRDVLALLEDGAGGEHRAFAQAAALQHGRAHPDERALLDDASLELRGMADGGVGLDGRGAIVLRQKWSRGQIEARFANMSPCLIGMEACVGAHHLSRKLKALGHDARLMPARYVRPYSKGQKNDFRDAEAIAEAVQRPTMKFVATKTADQLDLQALHRVRERLVSQRTGIINQIRAFLLERGIAVRQGQRFLRVELPRILATPPDVLSTRMVRVIEGLASDWHRLDERIEGLSSEIEELAKRDAGCDA